jgi:hypothetical protein
MTSGKRRLRILCEDRRTERFVRRLCERYRIQVVVPPEVSPHGKGAASAWVLASYAKLVRQRRSKSFQANLGLLVVIDGDNVGLRRRLQELDEKLDAAGLEHRDPNEPIAIFVPTWSIETWLAHLHGSQGLDEGRALKDDGELRELWRDGTAEAAACKTAAAAWGTTPAPLPSLLAAYGEAPRVGLGPRP